MLIYHVYRQRRDGTYEHLASTRRSEDARAVFNRWHSAYVICEGVILYHKNIPEIS